ncbi:deoxynucleoside triphosphate triphosphohydrolase SAMHD1-like isoform X2 [Seriola aureovittata]|uniref:deoxynucleoside triphosphate triphosphohydrolase SAMHD1-like isoform X2 n=1 Tax=Seriola aureovittata TaxID=2871759 RepID=UPI0024BE4968|nr:deoxynucleoside triphosphate triphosphohydrolase SAMHD1-like isoform X2 [Seriola aureovittata]
MAEQSRKRQRAETTSDSIKMPKTTLSLELPPDNKKWEAKHLCQHLQNCQNTVKDKKITVAMLKNLTYAEQRELCMSITEELSKEQGKVFNDPIHGHVELHPLLVKIINTPQFNRLRNIKQLGGAYFVFPGASHNRFEHSIGVAYLAGEFAQALKTKQPELDITDRDILCVQIAGLCHDLGHGPFSHLFDGMFLPKARPGKKSKHEEISLKMLDHLVDKNDLKPVMEQYGLEKEQDMKFIKEMIGGPLDSNKQKKWPYEGRGEDKSFLYEIVANKTNGIDVDKFDYFARDCHHLGIQNHFDHHRFFKFARVCEVEGGGKHICSRDKEKDNLRDMFENRSSLHRKAYQHKVNKLIETMITDAFVKADPCIQIEGSGGKTFTLSKAIEDIEAYTKLTDRVFEIILTPPSHIYVSCPEEEEIRKCLITAGNCPEVKAAREILQRIIDRDFYKCLGKIKTQKPTKEVIEQWKEELAQTIPDVGLTAEDFEIVVTSLDYRIKGKDPISNVYFYSKFAPDKASKIDQDQMDKLLSERFSEPFIRFYCKRRDKKSLDAAKKHFVQWCRDKNFPILEDGNPEEDSQNN